MRPQLLHLSGPERGRTVTYESPVVRIGSATGSEAHLDGPAVRPNHARIEWVEAECQFHLRRVDGQVFVNGTEVEEVILRDDDQLEFGAGGPVARFRVYVPIGAVCKPVRRMLADARDVARLSGGVAGTRTLTRDLLTQATLQLKVGFPVIVVASAFLAGWLGGWIGSRPSEEEVARTADRVTRAELDAVRADAKKQHEAVQRLAQANANVRRIQQEWSRGVCLIHGIFRVRMPDGTWFLAGGDPFEFEYVGSGFLVTAVGHVVTNRHVAVPWLELDFLAPVLARGGRGEFLRLTATFPGRAPLAVPQDSVVRRTDDIDVALFQLAAADVDGIPVLPLHHGPPEGEDPQAIVVGYPTGIAALLARADDPLVEELQRRAAPWTELIDALAGKGLVAPLVTRGIVSEVRERKIVYDASTTHGGSGGPVFGADGEVIAVNFGILPTFGGGNFGVPIRFAEELLPR